MDFNAIRLLLNSIICNAALRKPVFVVIPSTLRTTLRDGYITAEIAAYFRLSVSQYTARAMIMLADRTNTDVTSKSRFLVCLILALSRSFSLTMSSSKGGGWSI